MLSLWNRSSSLYDLMNDNEKSREIMHKNDKVVRGLSRKKLEANAEDQLKSRNQISGNQMTRIPSNDKGMLFSFNSNQPISK